MIGIVILNYKNYKSTIECVNSIIKNPPSEDYHIFIVDNGSPNESVEVLYNEFSEMKKISIHCISNNVGFARGNNEGISLCQEKGINKCVLSNSDILFKSGTLDELFDTFEKYKNCVIIGPRVVNTRGECMHSSRLQKIRLSEALEIGRLFPVKMLDEDSMSGVFKVHSVSGCCFAVDIGRFKEIGAFDESTFLYNEENILGEQVERSQYEIYIDLDTEVIHEHAASSGTRNDFVNTEYIRSTLYYWKTYRSAKKSTALAILCMFTLKMMVFSVRHKGIHSKKIFNKGYEQWKALYDI